MHDEMIEMAQASSQNYGDDNEYTCRVDASIMSRHVLWVIHTNKCGSVQLLGQCIVPYEIYHLINCIPTYCNFV